MGRKDGRGWEEGRMVSVAEYTFPVESARWLERVHGRRLSLCIRSQGVWFGGLALTIIIRKRRHELMDSRTAGEIS